VCRPLPLFRSACFVDVDGSPTPSNIGCDVTRLIRSSPRPQPRFAASCWRDYNLSRLLVTCAGRIRALRVCAAMADVVIVESPPNLGRYGGYTAFSSSSPGIPLLSDVLPKNPRKPPLRSGSKAAPIPKDAPASFTSAASVWRSAQLGPMTVDPPAEQPRRYAPKPVTRRKQAPKAVIDLCTDSPAALQPSTPPRLPTNDGRSPYSSPLSDKPWMKFKVKDTIREREQPLKTKEIKPVKRITAVKEDTPACEDVSISEGEPEPKEQTKLGTNEPLGLEMALPRRRDWTPPPEDTVPLGSDSLVAESDGIHTGEAEKAPDVFKNLHEIYARKSDDVVPATTSAVGTAARSKKRKSDDAASTSAAKISPAKAKAPKKRPRTITELATAAYLPPSQAAAVAARSPPKPKVYVREPPVDPAVAFKSAHPAAQPRKGFKNAVDKRKKKKTGTGRRNVLLSPVSAMRQSSRQDFLFGTSSQLAREETPAFLRELQVALKASNQVEEDPFADSPGQQGRLRPPEGKLWSAGARGSDGDLISLEVIDLVDSPEFPRDPMADALAPQVVVSPLARRVSSPPVDPSMGGPKSSASLAASDGRQVDANQTSLFFATQEPVLARSTSEEKLSTPVVVEDESPPPPSNQEASQTGRGTAAADAGEPQRPKYELFTDAQLAREVTSYGFKAIKRRTAMIALLHECWNSKRCLSSVANPRTASTSIGAPRPSRRPEAPPSDAAVPAKRSRGRPRKDVALPLPDTPALKRPRGRPRKDGAKAARSTAEAPVGTMPKVSGVAPEADAAPATPEGKKVGEPARQEIVDSESEPLFSSPEAGLSSPPAVDLSIGEDADMSLTISPTTQQSVLFGHITRAITTSPRSKDKSNPTWHEKMLMYDPIVLEDLAAWLNSGELDRVGYDGEVSPFDVKKWCESKSICCLWKVNLHGKERKRF